MAFDSTTRGKLQRLVTACRNLLTDEFDEQLQSIYGVYAEDGRVLELEKLPNLDDDERITGALLRERIAHLQSGLIDSKTPLKEAVQRVLREQAFTVLNRFAALRMAEERELVLQCVGDSLNSKGFQVFENVASPDLGSQYERYCIFLGCLFDELSLDLGVLFDRYSPFGLLFPREPKLKEFLQLLNDPELKSLWREDETIGWIYQYFNDPAERKQMREAAAPRNSRELAVRNQFFTPRYVVEFLIDNTLGRLWYEMTKGRTELARCCRYLLRRPNEVFLGNPNVISSLDAAAPWVRVVILTADFSRMPDDPTVGELSDFGLAIDGYAEMERRGRSWHDFIATFYNPQAEAAEKTGRPWKGDAFELWCALFAYQREVLRNGYFGDTDRATGDQTLCHLWPVLRRALQNPPTDLSQEEMLCQPQFIPHRPIKDPREIRLLDPACGSMHFGLYAFDLFETIYAEAHRAHVELGTEALRDGSGRGVLDPVSADAAAFKREVPRLIVESNIHGIDIDPRAVQIAGLSLWLRAQLAWQQAGVKSVDRPPITRSNLVCAESMPGEKELLREFVEQQFPAGERPAFAFLLDKIFDYMALAGEAGWLLHIEEEIRTVIREAKRVWREGPKHEQASLFSEATEEPGQGEMRLNLSGVTDEQFWARLEQRIYDALEGYAEKAENGGGFQRRLFAEDAARGFAFIDVCRKRYDVVVMNPPFGAFSKESKAYAAEQFPNSANDIFAAFIECSFARLTKTGTLGAITSRTGFFIASFADWRREIVQKAAQLNCFADLGGGVMDNATVEAAAYVFNCLARPTPSSVAASFIRLLVHPDKGPVLAETIHKLNRGETQPLRVFWARNEQFGLLPDGPFVYWADPTTLRSLARWPSFEPAAAQVRKGLRTGDNFRFVRALWEIPISDFTPSISAEDSPSKRESSKWVPLVLSGSSQPWFSPLLLALNWRANGKELRQYVTKYGSPSRLIQAEDFYFRPGMSWTRRAARFVPYAIPSGCIPTGSRPMAFPVKGLELNALALSASRVASAFMRFYGDWFTRPNFLEGKVKLFPWPKISQQLSTQLDELVLREAKHRRSSYRGHEPFFDFIKPFSLEDGEDNAAISIEWETLLGSELETSVEKAFGLTTSTGAELCQELDEALSVRGASSDSDDAEEDDDEGGELLLDCSERSYIDAILSHALGCVFGRWDTRYATGERPAPDLPDPFAPLPVCPPGMLQGDDGLPLSPEAGRRLRAEGRYPLDVVWGGILVDDPEHSLDLEHRVRASLTVLQGDSADALEHEACAMLGLGSLREYFRRFSTGKVKGYFEDHLDRYTKSKRKAPIYWPLSTVSGLYTLWLYYHRLNAQTLYTCVTDFVKPKLDTVTVDADRLQARTQAGGTAKERAELQELRDFQAELQELHDELLRVAQLPWKPNLNDGVLITASPLWKLFRLPKWQKELKACWEELAAGDYDWAHLALTIWPDRVREKCKTDRSLAIAHGLEDLCEIEAPKPKAKRAKKPGKEKPTETLDFQ